jgi:nidogen-like
MNRGILLLAVVSIATSSVFGAGLLYQLDSSYTLVDFYGDGPTGSGSAGTSQRNDDDSATVNTGFNFCFYGTDYSTLYVNNNGNLSFGSYFSTFSSTGFPVAGYPMIAPFWADVDTRNTASGMVYQKLLDSNGDSSVDTLVVTWDQVGYFGSHADKLNTFQVVISDGTNPVLGAGNNIAFSYGDMQWTTGDASGGSGGFGGTPATVGANKGDGGDFFQIGRFDHEGTDYDGGSGNNDGVSWLDDQTFFFNVCGSMNQAPIALNFPSSGIITLNPGDALNRSFQFIGPEVNDAVSVVLTDVNDAQLAGCTMGTVDGDPASATLQWTPDIGDVGDYDLVFDFTDSFGLSSQQLLTLRVALANGVVPEPLTMGCVGSAIAALSVYMRRRKNA